MMKTLMRGGLTAGLVFTIALTLGLPARADAQYFGRNKVQYDKFKFQILATEHFDVYYYPEEADAAKQVARMAERWYARLSKVLGHSLVGRQPLILYASHPDFEQTNVIEGQLGEGTGGVTESAKRRVIMPLAASLADTDHVLGHELVHAFQYDILGPAAGALPLWFIEGMAEYFSIGGRDAQTAMWLRDAALIDRLPDLKSLDDPRYFPYRFGHAFWAYIGGRYGDATVAKILAEFAPVGGSGPGMGLTAGFDVIEVIEGAVGMSADELAAAWHASIRETYGLPAARSRNAEARAEGKDEKPAAAPGGLVIGRKTGAGEMNVGPALSPDGTRIAFLSERDQLSIDLYLADATTGRIIKRLVETASDPHFESLQFLASAGAWDPKGTRLAIATIRGGKPVIAILDGNDGDVVQEVKFDTLGEIFQPTWSPDGNSIAFSAQTGGYTDLFIHDLTAKTTKRLTKDAYADLQPAWSPDGTRIAFVSDRFTSDLKVLSFGAPRIGMVTVATGEVTPLETGVSGTAVNPQWSGDSRTLFFISDAGGRSNTWRLDLESKQATQVTNEITGVAGITPASPALSVAARAPKAAVSIYRNGGHEIQLIDTTNMTTPPAPIQVADAAILPPAKRLASPVAEMLQQPAAGLPETADFPQKEYSPKLELVGVGQQIGVSTGGLFGTYASGGIALQFSDMLGEHLLGTSFGVDGGIKDISTAVSYLNRRSRWNWGVFGERSPYKFGTVRAGFANQGGQTVFVEQADIFRQTYHQGGVIVAYPFSRVTRVEFSGAARHISFDNEIRTRIFDPVTGALLGEDVSQIDAGESLRLFDATVAMVRDTSVFGATSPIKGDRLRIDYSPTFGDLKLNNVTLDYRQYFMPFRPITFAARGIHVARYGSSSEDERLMPLFLGYPTLVRGYDVNSFEASDCTITPDGSCPEFDQLLGSRMLVVNAEVRAPLVGLFNRRLDYGPVPVELFAFFDAGVAWTRDVEPKFADGTRPWVKSAGFGARVNLFGFAVGEFNMARPIDRVGRGWMFVFNLRPGF